MLETLTRISWIDVTGIMAQIYRANLVGNSEKSRPQRIYLSQIEYIPKKTKATRMNGRVRKEICVWRNQKNVWYGVTGQFPQLDVVAHILRVVDVKSYVKLKYHVSAFVVLLQKSRLPSGSGENFREQLRYSKIFRPVFDLLDIILLITIVS